MKHLYEVNEYGEIFAADSEDQARNFHYDTCGKWPEYVTLLDDSIVVPNIPDEEEILISERYSGKTYKQIAEEYSEPCQIWTLYT